MCKIYFIISDIHGHYNEMIESLKLNNYDKNNNAHHLVVLGDMFDRGNQSKEVLEYMYKLKLENKVSIVLGNHESFLIEFLDGNFSRALFNMKFNGFTKTLESLSGEKLILEDNLHEVNFKIKEKYIYLYNLLKSLPVFIEIKDYIFVHGGVKYGIKNWEENSERDFIWGRESQYEMVPGKTVVCGHERVSIIRYPKKDQKKLFISNPEAFDILRSDGKIYIDAYVEISKKINVLKLEL